MKKVNLFLLSCLFIALLASPAFADTARGARSSEIGECVAVCDVSGGTCAEIDTSGNLAVEIKSDSTALGIDSDGSVQTRPHANTITTSHGGDVAIVSGACTVYGIYVTGTTAGDEAIIYDAASATGLPKLDIKVGTANNTIALTFPGGATFSTGVYADVTDSDVDITVIYNN